MSYYNNQQSSYPGSSYPGSNEQSYPGGPAGFPSADTRGAVSSYPGGPDYGNQQQSSYPGANGPGYGNPQGQYPESNFGGSSQSYGAPNGQGYQTSQNGQEQVQYDEHGNPIAGERGIGTMALGAMGGFAANKMTGGHHGGMASAGAGAMLSQGGKMLYDMYKKNHNGTHPQQGQYNNQGYQGGSGGHSSGGGLGGLLGAFGK